MEEKELLEKRKHFEEMEKLGQINMFDEKTIIEQAVEKIRKDVAAHKNPMIIALGEQLIYHIETSNHLELAKKIVGTNKQLKELLKVFENTASKQRHGNMALLTPLQVEKLIIEFYELNQSPIGEIIQQQQNKIVPLKKNKKFSATLDEFLL